ncbi:MAG: DUF6502 family protein [Wenzhouxiangella sp.]
MTQQAKQTHPENDVGWLIDAVSRMLRPIVRLAIGRISCNALVALIRAIYVAEARAYLEAQNPERRVTRSALALLCGMDGRAIQQYEEASDKDYSASDLCSEAAILDLWQSDQDFIDPDSGQPRELLVHGPQGTFQRLVSRAAGRAVTAQTALDRLLESGNVALNPDGTHVRLVKKYFYLIPDSEQAALEAGSLSLNRLGKTLNHNIGRGPETPGWLQQDRWTLRVSQRSLDSFRAQVRALLVKHIDQVEQCLDGQERLQENGPLRAVGIGWYYWEDASLGESTT